MKDFLKDYGTLIGPVFAFTLGVIALYIKFYTDKQLESWRSKKRMKKLIELISESKPPIKYYPQKSEHGLHADQARNLTNLSIFYKRIEVVKSFIDTIENDVLTNCNVKEIQQFQDLKFITNYLFRDIESYRSNIGKQDRINEKHDYVDFSESEFYNLLDSYKRLIVVCTNPEKVFNYIEK